MPSTMPHQLAVLLLLLCPAFINAASTCESEKFPAGKSYATCTDLPHLGAALHWTYDKANLALSVAFVAAPASNGGWVAWGINPTGEGMKGAQALVAFKNPSSSFAVKTYNVTGYVPLGGASTPIAFPATDLAADDGGSGKIRLYAKLQLDKGMSVVNHVWQVGSAVTGGAPEKHAFAAENLSSKGKLSLAGRSSRSGGAPGPSLAPVAGGTAGDGGDATGASSSPAPSGRGGGKSTAVAVTGASAPVLLLALIGFLVML